MKLYRIDGTLIFKHPAESIADTLREAVMQKVDLTDLRLVGHSLRGLDFTGATLYNADIERCYLDDCDFTGANLRRSRFTRCKMERVVMHGADMETAQLDYTNMIDCDLSGAQVSRLTITGGKYTNTLFVRLRGTRVLVRSATFRTCTLTDMLFEETTVRTGQFIQCAFTGSNLGHLARIRCLVQNCQCDEQRKAPKLRARNLAEERASAWARHFAELRERHGYTFAYVTRITGINQRALEDMEDGKGVTDVGALITLLRFYKMDLRQLYYLAKPAGHAPTFSEKD